jgi:transposase
MAIQPLFAGAVGMDSPLRGIHVCVIFQRQGGEPEVHRKQFGTFKRNLRAMAEWIAGFSPETVVMESTGLYWKSPYTYLERVGIRALRVNAQPVKQVPGRKTDTRDAEWLAMRARAGLRRGSFIPPEPLRTLRQVSRYHPRTTAMRVREKNRLAKGLSDAGIRLSGVVSDLHGVAARAMIDGRLGGGTPEQALRHAGRLRAPQDELLASRQGELSEDPRFVARLIRHHIDALETPLADLERRLLEGLKPQEAALQRLLTLPGIDRVAAARWLVEIGDDRAAFGRADRLAKGAGMGPGNHESAGPRKRGNTAAGNRYVRTVLCAIAWAATRTASQFRSRFQGLVIRRGTQQALVAIGHKVLKIVFVLLARQGPYHEATVDYAALTGKRNAPRWIRALKPFGYLPQRA